MAKPFCEVAGSECARQAKADSAVARCSIADQWWSERLQGVGTVRQKVLCVMVDQHEEIIAANFGLLPLSVFWALMGTGCQG